MVCSVVAATLFVSSIAAALGSADWQSDYGKALAATRSDDRPLLVVLDVPSDPASAVATDHLESKGEQSELLDAYQRCHVDVSTDYGEKVAKVFGAEKFPFTAIIDKTGSVVLCKKMGQLSSDEWRETLAKYQTGERKTQTYQTSFYRGEEAMNAFSSKEIQAGTPTVKSPSYCPTCQLKAN